MAKTIKRSKAAFGKQIELYVKTLLLKEGADVYTPEVDDKAIDILVKTPTNHFNEIQVKAVTKGALFAAISHKPQKKPRNNNYWFIFYSEELDVFWILSSQEFVAEASQNKKGKHIGKYSIQFHSKSNGTVVANPKYSKYEVTNFRRITM